MQRTFATMSFALYATGFRAIMTGLLGAEVRCTWPVFKTELPFKARPTDPQPGLVALVKTCYTRPRIGNACHRASPRP